MEHGSLFSCIGGFDLAAEWMGWENIFHCEVVKWRNKYLKQRWPNAESHGDISTTSFVPYRGKLDVLSGGWPCQGNSRANQSGDPKGLQHHASGLFYEFARAIDESRPEFIVAENVPEVFTINGGRDFFQILTILSGLGYNAEWRMCYAAEVGAPHKRKRLYVVAYPKSIRLQEDESFFSGFPDQEGSKERRIIAGAACMVGERWQSESPILRVADGIPDRSQRIEAIGNAVVPEIPYRIFRQIERISNR